MLFKFALFDTLLLDHVIVESLGGSSHLATFQTEQNDILGSTFTQRWWGGHTSWLIFNNLSCLDSRVGPGSLLAFECLIENAFPANIRREGALGHFLLVLKLPVASLASEQVFAPRVPI